MTEYCKSLEKSVDYLRERYPVELPLLVSLEEKLEYLKSKNRENSKGMSRIDSPVD